MCIMCMHPAHTYIVVMEIIRSVNSSFQQASLLMYFILENVLKLLHDFCLIVWHIYVDVYKEWGSNL